MTIFVGDSLAGNDTVNQAREFHNHVKFDGSILTKSDADAKGGAALSIAKVTSTPVLYLGTGQEYSDLKSFDKNIFLETVFGSLNDVKIEQTDVSKLKESSTPEPEPMSEPEPEPMSEPEPEPEPDSDDPFYGITDDEIAKYSDLFDIPPPESDAEATKLGNTIRKWIKDGKPKPGESNVVSSNDEDMHKQDKEEEPKKKRGLFGRFKK
jgi:fused signal recognition particle receptor